VSAATGAPWAELAFDLDPDLILDEEEGFGGWHEVWKDRMFEYNKELSVLLGQFKGGSRGSRRSRTRRSRSCRSGPAR